MTGSLTAAGSGEFRCRVPSLTAHSRMVFPRYVDYASFPRWRTVTDFREVVAEQWNMPERAEFTCNLPMNCRRPDIEIHRPRWPGVRRGRDGCMATRRG